MGRAGTGFVVGVHGTWRVSSWVKGKGMGVFVQRVAPVLNIDGYFVDFGRLESGETMSYVYGKTGLTSQ